MYQELCGVQREQLVASRCVAHEEIGSTVPDFRLKQRTVLNKYTLLYSVLTLQLQYGGMCTCYVRHNVLGTPVRIYCIWYVIMWKQTLYLLQMVIPLLLFHQQGEELHGKT